MKTDPVCGMEVEETCDWQFEHAGQLFRFCSKECRDRFEREPSRYVTASYALFAIGPQSLDHGHSKHCVPELGHAVRSR